MAAHNHPHLFVSGQQTGIARRESVLEIMRMNDAFARVSYNFRHRKGTLKVGDSIQTRGKDLIGYGLVFGDNVAIGLQNTFTVI